MLLFESTLSPRRMKDEVLQRFRIAAQMEGHGF